MHVRLVPGVPEDRVGGRFEDAVQGERQLDGAEVGSEVAAVLGDGGDDEVADLAGQLVELGVAQVAEVRGLLDGGEHTWLVGDATARVSNDVVAGSPAAPPAGPCSRDPAPVEASLVPSMQPPADQRPDGEHDEPADPVDPVVVGGDDDA